MSRYIDAEWLLGVAELSKGVIDVDDVYNAPSIDIVRCKECKRHGASLNDGCVYCTQLMWTMNPDDFCSYGERSSE